MTILLIFDSDELEQLLAFAKQEFKFGSGGNSLKAKLESVWRQTGNKPAELDSIVELPDSMLQVWHWFIELNNARSSNGFGVNPLSYVEIDAYFRLNQITPETWEVSVIKKLDNIALEAYAEQVKQEQNKAKKK